MRPRAGRTTGLAARVPAVAGLAATGLALAVLSDARAASGLVAWVGGQARPGLAPDRLLGLALAHLALALGSLLVSALLGVGLGVLATRPAGRGLRPLVDALAAAAGAVPPVVVIALALPALGFGAAPVVPALVAYGLLPVLRAVVAALETVPEPVRIAARAVGLTPFQRLREVEFPLAAPAIGEGLRVALVLSVGTAAVGALAGTETLGTPIVVGLQTENEVLIVQGAAATAALAYLAQALLVLAMPAPNEGPARRGAA